MLNNLLKTLQPRLYKIFCAVFLVFILVNPVKAQVKDYYFENYTTDNGLSNNIIHCIFQDSRGWMWFGTSQGLDRFDGYKFTAFRNDPDYFSRVFVFWD